mgnify:CR=1 FL=1
MRYLIIKGGVKMGNKLLKKLSNQEMTEVQGGGYYYVQVCPPVPSYIKTKPTGKGISSVYAAWMWTNCKQQKMCFKGVGNSASGARPC